MLKNILFIVLVIVTFLIGVHAQTTAFTYQGSLKDGANPANGNYDFEFALFDALTNGNQTDSTVSVNNVVVANGIFTVKLDFGPVFPGADRFLEIHVRQAGGGGFTTLTPRQQVSSAPYSVKSLNSTTADTSTNATQLGGLAANQYVVTTDPRMNDARAPTAGSANYIQNGTSQQTLSNFNISGSGTIGSRLHLPATGSSTVGVIYQNNEPLIHTYGGVNLFTGLSAGNFTTTGQFNTFVGNNSGSNITTGGSNSFIGSSAGNANTTGGNNTFLGAGAGLLNTTASANTFVGSGSGLSNTTGSFNSFFGANSGSMNTTGHENMFFGPFSGSANTTGSFNSFFGQSSGVSNTIGNNNSFFGWGAGSNAATVDGNSFFGYSAGTNTTTGGSNSFFGENAGLTNTTGYANSFFGRQAGKANIIGLFNTFIGHHAGLASTTGDGNAFLGAFSGLGNTNGSYNIFIGENAGDTNVNGSNNVVIGHLADLGGGVLSNATAIGSNAFVSASNSIVLGSINGVNGATASTNVGIGTSIPLEKLHIADNGGNILMGNGTCSAGNAAIGFATTLSCNNYSLLGNGTNTVINRPTGGSIFFRENNTTQISIQSGGELAINTLGAAGATALCRNASNQIATCSSSLRYKTNIGSFSDGLSFVNKLRPISFDWKDGGMKDIGFGAEDIAKIDPRFVTYNDKGEVEGVKYDRMTTVLANAVKEQQEQIEKQQALIEKQQAMIEQLEKRLERLEKTEQK